MNVDLILSGGVIVTMDPQGTIIEQGAVAVQGSEIVAVGDKETIERRYQASEIIDCMGQVVIPGLVNAHTHVPMSLLRGMADDLRLDVWLMGYMMPVERKFVDPDFSFVGALLSCAEMIRSGVTTFCDMYYYEEDVARAVDQAGMRAVLGQTVMKWPTPDSRSYDEGLTRNREFIERWRHHARITPAVSPHAPYTCTEDILKQCTALALEYDVPLHIHLSETALEVTESLREFGEAPINYVDSLGLFEAKTIAAHCVHIEPREIPVVAAKNVGVAHCPTSNLKLASGVAPVIAMQKAGVQVGIGTDGCASNNDQDMFEELRLAALLPKGTLGDPTLLPARAAFTMATREGAKALHLGHITGSLVAGKRADIAVVDLRAPHLTPRFNTTPDNIYSYLVYAAHAADVRHVVCEGRILMRDRNLSTIDLAAVTERAHQITERIAAFLSRREASVLDKLIALGGLEREETFEVQVKVRLSDPSRVEHILATHAHIKVERSSVRQQFDTYFRFDKEQGSLRYREDNRVVGKDTNAGPFASNLEIQPRYSLTLIGRTYEKEYENSVILSRSRFTSHAGHSLRFYREYFRPASEQEIVKWRTRFHIEFKGEDFALNLDKLSKPATGGAYLEIKSRTWSQADALKKTELIDELLRAFGFSRLDIVKGDYVTF